MAMRHEGGEERPNVSRSTVESGEAARDEAPSAVAGGCLSPRWKCGRLHDNECSAETGADERPLIAVSAGNFNTANPKGITNKIPQSQSPPAENFEKKHIFSVYYKKQSYTMTEP